MIPLIPVDRQFDAIKEEILTAVDRVISSGQYILGKEVSKLEQELCAYLKGSHIISAGNGTDALTLALTALDIGPGDEVITTPFTFFATAEAISRVGAKPVFCDIDPNTCTINPDLIPASITARTKAILPVHLFGRMCDMDKLMDIAQKNNLYVIEDACQAFGAIYKGKKAGTIGDIGCYSFFPTKNLSTIGDGGAIAVKDSVAAERLRRLRQHGSIKKYHHNEIGYNSRLDEIHAAILRISLNHIDTWNQLRCNKARIYDKQLVKSGYNIPFQAENTSHVYHLYCIEHPERDRLTAYLTKNEIAYGIYYPLPLHLQTVYKDMDYQKGDFPVSEEKAKRLLALPMHPALSQEEQNQVIHTLQQFADGAS